MTDMPPLSSHYVPRDRSDRAAYAFVRFLRFIADAFFARRYGHRAVVLETVAAVPGMVGGSLQHLRSLRRMEDDHGWIRILLDEAENERMHLMTFMEIVRPSRWERLLVLLAQGIFYNLYFLFYLVFPGAAHTLTHRPFMETQMNKNQIEGTIRKTAGKIQQKVGKATGSSSQQIKGAGKQLEGSFQKRMGDAQQSVDDATMKARTKP